MKTVLPREQAVEDIFSKILASPLLPAESTWQSWICVLVWNGLLMH